jgi:hypothetical protein
MYVYYTLILRCCPLVLLATQCLCDYCGESFVFLSLLYKYLLRVLDNFLFYGITEYFSESICLLAFTVSIYLPAA